MTLRNKRPDRVLQHEAGAEPGCEEGSSSATARYATFDELQRRHVMRCCGDGGRHAKIIAGLFFGEGRK